MPPAVAKVLAAGSSNRKVAKKTRLRAVRADNSAGPESEQLLARYRRIDHRIRRARQALAGLPPHSPLAHLLQVAILRKDDALLEGLLAQLDAALRPRR
jgi:hypothetical protein